MLSLYLLLLIFTFSYSYSTSSVTVKDVPLIPRKDLIGNFDKESLDITASGKILVYLAPLEGVQNIWTRPLDLKNIGKNVSLPVTYEQEHDILGFTVTHYESIFIYWQDRNRNGKNVLYKVDLSNENSNQPVRLTPACDVNARIVKLSRKYPSQIVIEMNDRNQIDYDLFFLNITSGAKTLLYQNEQQFVYFAIDGDLKLRLAANITQQGDIRYYESKSSSNGSIEWTYYDQIDSGDTHNSFTIIIFDSTGETFYTIRSKGRNLNAMYSVDFKSKNKTLLYESVEADIEGAFLHPTGRKPQIIWENLKNRSYKGLDESIKGDLEYLSKLEKRGELGALWKTTDNFDIWLVSWNRDDKPLKYYIYDRKIQKATYLFSAKESLIKYTHSLMQSVEIKTRDSHQQLCYITKPIQAANKAQLPMIVTVRKDVKGRTSWGFDQQTQFLANRGYVVLQCNFRSSTGLGKEWIKLGNGELGKKMLNDLIDAVMWAMIANITNPSKVAILGEGYGGYATLDALQKIDSFACGVDINGYSNLLPLVDMLPEPFARLTGVNLETDEGECSLIKRSPYFYANEILKPLLVFHSPNDLVPRKDSDFVVNTLKSQHTPVTYALFPNTQSPIQRHKNVLAQYAVIEKFLAKCLGGRAESADEAIEQSSAEIIEKGILTD